ncbi:MAG: DMT family transporter [Pseudomonadota bacterium]|nr:DMT family transporter [Pseudomonadota bacterium]
MIRAEWVLIIATVMWGTSWIPLHGFAAMGLSGMPMVLAGYGLIGVLSVPLVFSQRARWQGQIWGLLAIVGFGGWANAALVSSLSLADDLVRVMLLFYLAPVWSVLGGWLWLRERVTALRWLALSLAMTGIVLTLGVGPEVIRPLAGADWLALSAGLGFALNNLATRAADQIPMASKTFAAFIGSALFAWLACGFTDQSLPALPLSGWLLVAAFAVGWLLVATLAAQYGVSHLEAGKSAVLIVFELIAAVCSAAWLGDQSLGPVEWLGAALVAIAAIMAAWPETPEPALMRS